MSRKVISFFLASSIVDLAEDRESIRNFVSQLNNIYQPHGIYIRPEMCEGVDMDHSFKVGGSQSRLDRLLCSSDLCFVIFFEKVGDVTLHELKLAVRHYEQYDNPKVVVYFKQIPDDRAVPGDIQSVMKIIDEELLHYHREYTHIDSLKLGIITQLQVLGFVNLDLRVEDSKIIYNDKELLPIAEIPLFGDNQEYMELCEKYRKLCQECDALQKKYNETGSLLLRKKLQTAMKHRSDTKEELDDLTQSIFDLSKYLARIVNTGSLSDNSQKAIRCFDAGDYEGVLALLDPDEIDKDFDEVDRMEEQLNQKRRMLIEESRLRIMALKATGKWPEVESSYEALMAQIRNHPGMPKQAIFEYADFLYTQNNYQKCIEICDALEKIYLSEGENNCTLSMVDFYCLYGLALYDVNHYEKARLVLEKSMEISASLQDACREAKAAVILARLYDDLTMHKESEALYQRALEIYDHQADRQLYSVQIADVYEQLAHLYYQMNRHSEADAMYDKALNIFLLQDQPCAARVADLCGKLAGQRCAIRRHKKIDRVFLEALYKRNELMQSGENAFYLYLGEFCAELAFVYEQSGCSEYSDSFRQMSLAIKTRQAPLIAMEEKALLENDFDYYKSEPDYEELEAMVTEALRIRKSEAENNLDAYELSVSRSYADLGFLYMIYDRLDQAESMLTEAKAIQENLVAASGNYAKTWLAITYCNLAEVLSRSHRCVEAEMYYHKALQIYQRFSTDGEGVFENEIIRTTSYLATHYAENGQSKLANEYYFRALSGYIQLYCKSPTAYIDRVLNTAADIVHLLSPDTEKSVMDRILHLDGTSI